MVKERTKVTTADLAYFSGLFDGEGCITLQPAKKGQNRVTYQSNLTVNMSHLPTIQKIQQIWGLGSIQSVKVKEVIGKKYKPMWKWVAMSNQALYVLELSLPFLCTKRHEAELGIAFQREKARRNGIWKKKGSCPDVYFQREKQVSDILKRNRQCDNPDMGMQIEAILRDGQMSLV